jgi:CHAT domain-containing protein/tetratricopeptide (TPR) repeat protein
MAAVGEASGIEMTTVSSGCPSRKILAAARRGALAEEAMNTIAIHVRQCTTCREAALAAPPQWTKRIVVVSVSIVVVLAAVRSLRHDLAPLPVNLRPAEARLSGGFEWARYDAAAASTKTEDERVQRKLAAASMLAANRGGEAAADPRREKGIRLVLDGRSEQAVPILERAAAAANDRRIWSDLGASYYELASDEDDPARLGDALASIDAALRLDPNLPEALFNRALVLERLGLRDQARQSWERYLTVDAGSGWAIEARGHVSNLAPEESFADVLAREYEQLAKSPADAHELAHRFPQEARTWGETEILGRWAAAEAANDPASAAKHLAVARELGSELVGSGGDRMLAAAVAAIDGAGANGRQNLVAGHLAFREGQQEYKKHKAAVARPIFMRAAAAFDRGGSPLARAARTFIASTMYDTGQVAEAIRLMEGLVASAPPEFAAHQANDRWQLGRFYAIQGRWGKGLETLNASAAGFKRLGETNFAAAVREILTEVYDRIGNSSAAWHERIIMLRALGRSTTPRLQMALAAMTRAAATSGRWPIAASFAGLELEAARGGITPVRRVEMLLLRAQIEYRLQSVAAARQDVADARITIAAIEDAAMAEYLDATAAGVEALVAASPEESIALLSPAIATLGARDRQIQLPELLLHRGRAYAATGDHTHAAADFEDGIAKLEATRESLPNDESRWGVFDASKELFDEAIALALKRNDAATAFAYSERLRARQLLDTLGAPWPTIEAADVPPATSIVEYASLADRVVIFVFDSAGVRVTETKIDRSALKELVTRFSDAIANGQFRVAKIRAAALHRLLIEPVAPMLAANLVIVPDAVLDSVPFSTLFDDASRQYLIERSNVVISPSAAVFARLTGRNGPAFSTERLLVVANPALDSDDEPSLPGAEREVARLSRLYRHVTTLVGADATVAAFVRAAPDATLLHFAGHAVAGIGRKTALLLSPANGDDGRLDPKLVASIRLNPASTVILAACDTARGETRLSEGTISLARAFVAAGARGVIATLLPVEDNDAEDFFARLHVYLARGIAPAEALRAVQIDWIRRSETHLATWASVQLIGS